MCLSCLFFVVKKCLVVGYNRRMCILPFYLLEPLEMSSFSFDAAKIWVILFSALDFVALKV